jgi:Na+/alanine symporter
MIRTSLLAAILFFSLTVTQAQEKTATDTTAGAPQQQVEMADVMRSEGKIYVVVGIILIVLAIMLIYLFTIDRNVKRLEKQLAEKGK